MIEHIDLSQWKKQKQIIIELEQNNIKISKDGRQWREAVKQWNKKWKNGEVPYYVTHSSQLGFKATTDYREAKIGRNDYLARLKANRENILDCDEGFEKFYNCKIDFETGDIL